MALALKTHAPALGDLPDEPEILDLGAVSDATGGIGGEVPEGLTTYAP